MSRTRVLLCWMKLSFFLLALSAFAFTTPFAAQAEPGPWPAEKANAWSKAQPWLVGANFGPSTAINQLEMWQAETFDVETIDRELGWAESLGMNSMRVFLHNLLWEQDKDGFLKRMDQFLGLCSKHKIGVMFTLLDSVWDPDPKVGKQREPQKGLHNSGWVQAPGRVILSDAKQHDALKPYVFGVINHFKNDARVHVWDLINEPENDNRSSYGKSEPANKKEMALELTKKCFLWAREAAPSQPLTVGVWIGNWGDPAKLSAIEKLSLEQSDVISFHNYGPLDHLKKCVDNLRRYQRPILCTEYMARPMGSTFDPHLAYLKEQKVAAYNWGFVAGKTNTIYPWDSWQKRYETEPPVWFHDIFRADGTAYRPEEVTFIRKVTGKTP